VREVVEQQVGGAVVGILRRDHVIAGSERLQDGERGSLAGRERRCCGAALELRQARLERLPVWIA
jgi:hypothetical protein